LSEIFIIHEPEDDDWALALSGWLAREGWDDSFVDLDPGRDDPAADPRWKSALQAAAARCEAVLFLISESSRASDREYHLALQLGKRSFILQIRDKFRSTI
jgi:hypothetical protein